MAAKKTSYKKRATRAAPKAKRSYSSTTTNMQPRDDHSEIIQCFTHVTGTDGVDGKLGITIPVNPSRIPGPNGGLAGATANPQWIQLTHRFEQFRLKGASIQITLKHCDSSVFTSLDQEARDMVSSADFLSDAGMRITHLSADKRTVYMSYKPVMRSAAFNFQNTIAADVSVFTEAIGHVLQLCPGATVAPSAEVLVKYYVACRGMKRFVTTLDPAQGN